jgi:tRNA-modifying protein YgfZ
VCYIGFVEQKLVDEAKLAREGAALTDRTGRGLLVARGNDRQAFLHNMLSNAIAGLSPGQGCRAELLDERGHVVADFRVHVLDGEVQLDCETPAISAKAFAALDKFIIMDDVQLTDASAGASVFTVSGPKAGDVLRAAGVTTLPTGPYASTPATIAGRPVLVVASPSTGRGDFDLHLTENGREAVQSALVAAGARVISSETFEALRIEAGVTRQVTELDDVLALEANLAPEAISFTKGCYLGQEVMARIDARGHVNRLLVGITLEGDAPATRGATLRAGEKDVGRVTSSALSPTLGKPIALAYLRREHSAPGTPITVHSDAGDRPAVVAALPFA